MRRNPECEHSDLCLRVFARKNDIFSCEQCRGYRENVVNIDQTLAEKECYYNLLIAIFGKRELSGKKHETRELPNRDR